MNYSTNQGGDLEVREVSGLRNRLRFVELPRQLYRDDPNFVPPIAPLVLAQLNERRNPFFEHARQKLFLAWRGRSLVGRIAAVVDDDLQHRHDRATGVFGFLEMVADPAVLSALLTAACRWLASMGVEELLGPIQHSTNHESGLLVEGFDTPPFVMMTHNPPWYETMLLAAGFDPAMDLLAYRITRATLRRERVRRIAARVLERSQITLRALEMRRFEQEAATIRTIYNAAWEENWGFVPLSDREFRAQAKDMKRIIQPELCVIAERRGQAVGFGLALPNINEAVRKIKGRLFPLGILRFPRLIRKVRGMRVITMGILPEHRAGGLEAPLILEIAERGERAGFLEAELSWILESNRAMCKAIETIGGSISKRYRLYAAPLERILEKSSS